MKVCFKYDFKMGKPLGLTQNPNPTGNQLRDCETHQNYPAEQ